MTKRVRKISKKWIEQNRLMLREFLDETDFPDPERTNERVSKFQYPITSVRGIAASVRFKPSTVIWGFHF
jgi:hypothetical protein